MLHHHRLNCKAANDRVRLIADLKPHSSSISTKSGSETWACAFSSDESFFAWSCGHRFVVLVPWNRAKSCPVYVSDKDCNGNDIKSNQVIIDCGYLVWSMAFGSAVPDQMAKQGGHWMHSQGGSDLILATGLSSSRIRIWDVYTGKLLLELIDHRDIVQDLAFAPDGSLRLVSASRDSTLKVWDLYDDGNMFKTLQMSKNVVACAWSPNSKFLASVGSGAMVMIWNMETYVLHRKLEGHCHDVVSCDFSPDGALLVTASWDTNVHVWDPETGVLLRVFGHMFPPPSRIFASGANGHWVQSVSFSSDGCHIASVAEDGYLRFWRLFGDADPVQVSEIQEAVSSGFTSSGKALAVGTRSGCVTIWSSPSHLPSLKHLSRMAIRRHMSSVDVSSVEIPHTLRGYLQYKTWD